MNGDWHAACPSVAVDHETVAIGARKGLTTATRLFAAATVAAALACDREPEQRRIAGSASPAGSSAPRAASAPKRMSEAGLARIRDHEAFMSKQYDDGAGNATIGYGHLVREGEDYSDGVTEEEAIALFRKDVERVVNPALDKITVELTQNQIDALGSFIFNVGPGAFENGPLRHINARQHERVTSRILKYVTGRDMRTGERIVLRGLLKRRRAEVALYNSPQTLPYLRRAVGRATAWIVPIVSPREVRS
ncbi:MAG TPA: lysozyme [Gemmatimonadaceae bacterium]|nr:lysozyme [Gemmatimonadaceae bacterium]